MVTGQPSLAIHQLLQESRHDSHCIILLLKPFVCPCEGGARSTGSFSDITVVEAANDLGALVAGCNNLAGTRCCCSTQQLKRNELPLAMASLPFGQADL